MGSQKEGELSKGAELQSGAEGCGRVEVEELCKVVVAVCKEAGVMVKGCGVDIKVDEGSSRGGYIHGKDGLEVLEEDEGGMKASLGAGTGDGRKVRGSVGRYLPKRSWSHSLASWTCDSLQWLAVLGLRVRGWGSWSACPESEDALMSWMEGCGGGWEALCCLERRRWRRVAGSLSLVSGGEGIGGKARPRQGVSRYGEGEG
jgi:hypothetical protein